MDDHTVSATCSQFHESMMTKSEDDLQKAPLGVAGPEVYGKLLCCYLLLNDVCNAKFLWKRIPQAIKMSNPELGHIWGVGQMIWQRDFPRIYESLQREWNDPYKDIMAAVLEAVRKRAFNLIALAYSSINAVEFAAIVGLPVADAVKAAQAEGWQADAQAQLIKPRKPLPPKDPVLVNEQQLSVLTDYVSFLES